MKPSLKRLLIVFSVFLNAGCLAALAVMLLSPGEPSTHEERRLAFFASALEATDIPLDEKEAVLSRINTFFNEVRPLNNKIRQAKFEQFQLLAAPGEVDRPRMRSLEERIDTLERQRASLITNGMLLLRRDLGEGSGRAFFDSLLSKIKEKRRSR